VRPLCAYRVHVATRRTLVVGLIAMALMLLVRPASAHPLSPAALVLVEEARDHFAGSFRRSELARAVLHVAWPAHCRATPGGERREADQWVESFSLHCPGGLFGQVVRVHGLEDIAISTLLYATFLEGESVRAVLTAAQPAFTVPARTTRLDIFRDYLALGAHHLVTGADHLLFILGLLFLVQGAWALVSTLTAFTLGHSVTLCAAALGVLRVPEAPVEVGIALSLVVLALSLLDPAHVPQRPGLMAFGFGLLHGLGFAGALASTGLPEREVATSLFAFNLGIELAQVALVLPLLGLGTWLRKRPQLAGLRPARTLSAYAIGALAAMWCIERTLAWLG
jgi:hydrogenase/urease accessory protein HupE